jgi:hypothetical protein
MALRQEWETLGDRQVIKGWTAQLEAAQRFYPSIRLRWDGESRCHDCAAAPGQLHVPGCDMEVCPSCKGQLFTCDCDTEMTRAPWPPVVGH